MNVSRVVELNSGTIEIDGIDISRVPLSTLRRRLALVPQDTTLFLGTLRENLFVLAHIFNTKTYDCKVTLSERVPMPNLSRHCRGPGFCRAIVRKLIQPLWPSLILMRLWVTKVCWNWVFGRRCWYCLGSNYSTGEKQLLALCRALVKDSQIIVLVSNFFRSCHLLHIAAGRGNK